MPGTVGAELDTLRRLHTTFQQKAAEALDIKAGVNNGLGDVVWTGRYADDFRAAWTEYSRNLDNLHTALIAAARDVRSNHNNIAEATGEPERV